MHAIISGRGRNGPDRHGRRFIYTGNVEPNCDMLTFCTYMTYSVSGAAAIAGVLLTVFGSTGYFQTNELNRLFLYIGIALLLIAAVLIGIAFGFQLRTAKDRKFSLALTATRKATTDSQANVPFLDECSHSPSPATAAAATFPNNSTDPSCCTNNPVALKSGTLDCSISPKMFLSDSRLNQHQLHYKDCLSPTHADCNSVHSADDTGLEDRRPSSKSFLQQI